MPFGAVAGAIGELAGQAQLAGRGLAHQLLVLLAAQPLLGQLDDAVEQIVGARRIGGQPVVEVILDRRLDQTRRLDAGELLLGLALELRLADEEGEHHRGPAADILRRDLGRLAIAGQLAIGLERAGEAAAQARLMGAALGRRHGVAIGVEEALAIGGPGDGPFQPALIVGQLGLAGEGRGCDGLATLEAGGEEIAEAAGEMQHRLRRRLLALADQRGIAAPADLDAAEEIGLGARHAVEPRRLEARLLAEDLGIGMEAHLGAAPIDIAAPLQLARRACRGHSSGGRAACPGRPRPPACRRARSPPRGRRHADRRRSGRPCRRTCRRNEAWSG